MNFPTKYDSSDNEESSTHDDNVIVYTNIFTIDNITVINKVDSAWISPMQCAAEKSFHILPIQSSPLQKKPISPQPLAPLSPLSPIFEPSPSIGLLTPNVGVIPYTPAIHQTKSYPHYTPIALIMSSIISLDKKNIDLSGWISKMCDNSVDHTTNYNEYYLFIKDHHLIWNNTKIKKRENVDVDIKNLRKFSGFIHFFLIKRAEIYVTGANNGYKFILHTHCPGSTINNEINNEISIRSHVFKCQTKRSRDKWVNGINKHCKYTSNLMNALQNSDL